MRALALLALLALAGCASGDPAEPAPSDRGPVDVEPARSDPVPPAPVHLDERGTIWLPTTTGSGMAESRVPFGLNGTADVHVSLHLGSTLTPIATARAVVELRDTSGKVLAQAEFTPPTLEPNEKTMEAFGLVAGPYELRFGTYGGSDGSANGDYIDYLIQAGAASP